MQIQFGNDDIDFSKLIEFEWSSTQMQSQDQNLMNALYICIMMIVVIVMIDVEYFDKFWKRCERV